MAYIPKQLGTTETSFSIALNDVAFTPNKLMDGVTLTTSYDSTLNTIFLNENIGSTPTNIGLWLGPTQNGSRIHFGGDSGAYDPHQIQASVGSFSLIAASGSMENADAGANIVWSGGVGKLSTNGNGGNATISAGNGEGLGNGGDVLITAGSPNGTGHVGDVSIQGRNIEYVILGDMKLNTDAGTSGQVIKSNGPGNPPTWTTPAAGTVTSVSGTAPVVSSGGTTPAISMAKATGSVDGYLSSTDWTTFNSKGSGTVTAISVASSNGFAGTSSGGATPALTLSTSITGVLYGNGTSLAASNVTNDAQVKVSDYSAKGIVLVGTGSGTFAALSVGSNTQVLTADSTQASGVKWATPSAPSFAIGTVIAGPSAPTDGGTWLECNGQSVSQSTYATLFGVIAHNYLKYKITRGTQPAAGWFAATTLAAWDGTNWISIKSASTTVYTSTDGLTWSAGTALPGALTSPILFSDQAGRVMAYTTASTTAYLTSNHGSTWSTITLSATGAWNFANNGANWIGIKAASTAITTSTNSGATWATSGSTLPVTPATIGSVWWNGSAWKILSSQTSGMSTQLITTSTASGASGWSNTYSISTIPASQNGANNIWCLTVPGSGKVITTMNNTQPIFYSSDSGSTFSIPNLFSTAGSAPPTMYWNGVHWLGGNGNALSGVFFRKLSSDASYFSPNYEIPIAGASTGPWYGFGGNAAWISNGAPTVIPGASMQNDTTNYRMLLTFAQDLSGSGSQTQYIYTLGPNITTSTNFNVLDIAILNSNINTQTLKSWIKAL